MAKIKKCCLLAFSIICSFGISACNETEPVKEKEEDIEIRLSAPSQTVFVGETSQLEVAFIKGENVEDKTLVWISSNSSVASVDSGGGVKGLKEGKVTITAALKTDLNVRATLEIFVVTKNDAENDDVQFELKIQSLPTKLTYTQGTYLDLTGLKVVKTKVGDEVEDIAEEVTDYTTNPPDGTYLSNIGKFSIVVSSPGCKSTSFEYEVIEAISDESFANVLDLIDSNDDNYTLDTSLDLMLTSGRTQLNIKEQYTDKAYYYTENVNDLTYSYGFAEGQNVKDENGNTLHKRGVFKYTIDENNQVVPGVYYNHSSPNIYATSLGVISQIEALDSDLASRRLIDDTYFNVTDAEYISNLLMHVGLAESNSSLIESAKAFVKSENNFEVVLTFVNDIGTISYDFSNIGETTIPAIEEYLDSGLGGADGPEEMKEVGEVASLNNYVVDLGEYDAGLMTVDIGKAYYTENYLYFDYTEDFISLMSSLNPTSDPLVDYGCVMMDDGIYEFTAPFSGGTNEIILASEPSNTTKTIPEFCQYIGTLDIFNEDNLDYFEEGSLNASYSGYLAYYKSLCTDVNDALQFDPNDTYDPYSTGVLNVTRDAKGVINSFMIFYAFKASSSQIGFYVREFKDFGKATVPVMEDFLGNDSSISTM